MRTIAILTVAALLLVGTVCLTSRESRAAVAADEEKVLRHVVLFGFKKEATKEQIAEVEAAFAALPKKIAQIKAFEWGTNVSPENLAQGHTHCFFLTFATAEDRDAYLVHPAHKNFGGMLGPVLDKVTVVDYWVKR